MPELDLPKGDIAEITLIGTGGGYGESCVIHLGNKNWIVIDSCQDPVTKTSLPLKYLTDIGVDLEFDVKLILCTHWDDDHIRGISELFEACKKAEFAFARTLDTMKFLRMVSMDYQKFLNGNDNSSTIEFSKCLDILIKRGLTPIQAVKDRILKSFNLLSNFRSEVVSLSPSDYAINNYDLEISTLIKELQPRRKIIIKNPNSKSIALFLKIGLHRVILGGDLINSKNQNEGWLDIISNNQVIDKKSSLFKIPHHGSYNSFHDDVWQDLLSVKPTSILTPFSRGLKLPESGMIRLFSERSSNFYMTSNLMRTSGKRRDRSIEKMLNKWGYKLEEIKYNEGKIRCRIAINIEDAIWDVSLFGRAIMI